MPPRRHPSVPGLPGVALPTVESRPPMASVEGERLFRELRQISEAMVSLREDVRRELARTEGEMLVRIAALLERLDGIQSSLVAAARADVEIERRLGEHAAQLATMSARAGHDAGRTAGIRWGAVSGPLGTALLVLVLALASAGLRACGVDVPQPVLESGHP